MDELSFYHKCWLTLKSENPRLRKRMDEVEIKVANFPTEPIRPYVFVQSKTAFCLKGIDTGGGVGLDYTVGCVLGCRIPFRQKAVWRSNLIRPAAAAEEMAELGWYYNNALLVIESNAIGAGLLSCLLDTHKYINIYRKEEHLDADPNISDKFGWSTTQTSKNLLLTEFQQSLREDGIILHDKTTIEEFCNYVYLQKQNWTPNQILKTGAMKGLNDDCVIATMLALHVARLYPQSSRPEPEPKLSADVAQQRALMRKFMDEIRAGHQEMGQIV